MDYNKSAMKSNGPIKQNIMRIFRSIIAGIMATVGSFLFVSVEISIVATILSFKGKGILDDAILQPYIDTIIQLTSVPSHLLMILIVALYLALKWKPNSAVDKLILTTSAFISVCWLGHYFGGLKQITILFKIKKSII